MIQSSVLPWRWEHAGSVSAKRSFGIAAIWRKPRGILFYRRLNEVLEQAGFDEFCETRCRKFYHEKLGRPSLAPGMYFRVMLIGFFEGIESERGIAWRVADSLWLRQCLQIGLDERTPDHVTISRTRRLMDEATRQEVFGWVLRQVARAGLLRGKTIGIDATTLEANAAMKSIVRRDTEESYTEYLTRLAESARLEASDEAALRRMDRRRKKKGSNQEWVNPYDPEAEITRLKNGRTALAYKAEHAVDMDTGAIVAVHPAERWATARRWARRSRRREKRLPNRSQSRRQTVSSR
jgi:transposase